MGHNIQYRTFPINTTKEEMFQRRSGRIRSEGDRDPAEGYLLSHDNGFTLHKDKIYDCWDDAKEAIDRYARGGFYDDHGVLYKEASEPSKAMQDLDRRIQETQKKKRDFYNSHLPNRVKAEFVGCPECKSKIAKIHLKTHYCPVCRKSMLPKSTKERLQGYDAKVKDLEAKYKDLERKQKGEVFWLVKLEFHT